MSALIDLTGQTFNRLTVVEQTKAPSGSRRVHWLCRCACGNEVIVDAANLKSGHTKSCGCLANELVIKRTTKHGLSKTPLFNIWWAMLNRCENPKVNGYSRYGGRGIKVCPEWHDSTTFLIWALSHGYKEGLSIERVDNNGNYGPDNCKWITRAAQASNTSRNKWVTAFGETLTARQTATKYNISYPHFIGLLNRGWKAESAIQYQQTRPWDNTLKRIDVSGETLTLSEAGNKYNLHPETIRSRLARGWTEEDAATIPRKCPGPRKRKTP